MRISATCIALAALAMIPGWTAGKLHAGSYSYFGAESNEIQPSFASYGGSAGCNTCGGQAECGCPSCSSCSATACDCGNCGGDSCSCGHDECLFGIIAPTSLCFADFISPMTNPVFFEDPRTLTEARIIYLRHKVPLTALGGEVNLFACQLRAALNDRLSIIATKDGYITSTNPLINDGWADVSAGLKYNLYSDYENQQLLSAGATFELPVGSTRT